MDCSKKIVAIGCYSYYTDGFLYGSRYEVTGETEKCFLVQYGRIRKAELGKILRPRVYKGQLYTDVSVPIYEGETDADGEARARDAFFSYFTTQANAVMERTL